MAKGSQKVVKTGLTDADAAITAVSLDLFKQGKDDEARKFREWAAEVKKQADAMAQA